MDALYNKNFEELTISEVKEAYERAKNAYRHILIAEGKSTNDEIVKRIKEIFEDYKGL